MYRHVSVVFFFVLLFSFQNVMSQKLAIEPFVTGLNNSIDIKNCGDNRLFVACQTGQIRIINADGTLRSAPFLDISSKIHPGSEDGLLGIAFSTNYKTDRKFFVYYIGLVAGQRTIFTEQYKVSAADSNVADLSSALTILTQGHLGGLHVGGNIMFGKDGYLYINLGDGAENADSMHTGQDVTTFLGKVLRVDISNSSINQPYTIPPTNQFYNSSVTGIKKEIWALGVRNPWRSSVDRLTGDLWIADVGEYMYEEIDYQAAGAAIPANGINYGWSIVEGDYCYHPPSGCNTTGLTMPIYEYQHPPLGPGCVIGGYVYRSAQSKTLFGTYIFADWALQWVNGLQQTGGTVSGPVSNFITSSQIQGRPISFGEDWMGDQYILFSGSGTIYKISDTSYQRHPKAYYTTEPLSGGTSFLLHGLQGKNLTYQWLKNNSPVPGATSPDYTVTDAGNYHLVVTNNLGFKDTSDVFSSGASPLNLFLFTAQKMSTGKILVQWKTDSETNIKEYDILRKQDNETNFSNIGSVISKSKNTPSNIELDYSFTDSSTVNYSKRFYRLKIEHSNGAVTYSNIVFVSSELGKNDYIIFPNPAKGQVQLSINQYTGPVIMTLYDNTGKAIKQQTITEQSSTINLPASRGLYIIELCNKDGSNKIRKKLVAE